MSTAMIGLAPGERGPGDRGDAHAAAADHGDRLAAAHRAGVDRGTEPGHHAAAQQPDRGRSGRRVDLGALPGGDQGLLGERADAERGRELGAVLERHLLGGVERREAVPRLAAVAGPAVAADRPPVEDDEVTRRQSRDVRSDRLDHAGRLVPEQERELVVDAALPVVQVGVADAARLHPDQRLPRPRVGHVDRGQLDRLPLGLRHDCPDLLHPATSSTRRKARRAPCNSMGRAFGSLSRRPASRGP